MNIAAKLYYKTTAHLPRKLPESQAELVRLKFILSGAFSLEDKEQTWAAVLGQITSTPAHKMRKSYATLANAARRMTVNAIAQEEKMRMVNSLQARLQKAAEEMTAKMNEEEKNDQTSEIISQAHGEPQQAENQVPTQTEATHE